MMAFADFKKHEDISRAGITPRKKTRVEVRRAFRASKLKFNLTWEQLSAMTREP